MDEPCSALDPISTSAIEDLIHELKTDYTIVIVTHNMQQAARVSEDTAFFNLAGAGKPGHLVEINPTAEMFTNPTSPPPRPTSPAASAERACRSDEPDHFRVTMLRGRLIHAGGCIRRLGEAGRVLHGGARPVTRVVRRPGRRSGQPDQGSRKTTPASRTQGGDARRPGRSAPRRSRCAGHAPADGREALGGARAHDRRGDHVGGRDRRLVDERGRVEHAAPTDSAAKPRGGSRWMIRRPRVRMIRQPPE